MSRAGWLFVGCGVVGVCLAAAVSTSYWGFPFGRPAIPEVAQATGVGWVAALRAAKEGSPCILEVAQAADLRHELAGMRGDVGDFPQIRALVGLDARGLLPSATKAPEWLDTSVLEKAVADTGMLVHGEAGYRQTGCYGGYLIEINLPAKESRLLLTAVGPEVSNDHHPFYEVVFRREGMRLIPERSRVTFFDIAGIEGFEWPILHAAFVMLCLLLAGCGWGVLSTARTAASFIAWRRRTRG
jgi:hypothetical protein